jgi:hypothetical protein
MSRKRDTVLATDGSVTSSDETTSPSLSLKARARPHQPTVAKLSDALSSGDCCFEVRGWRSVEPISACGQTRGR